MHTSAFMSNRQFFFPHSLIEQARGMGGSSTMTSMRRAHVSHILLIGIIGVAGELVEDVQPVSIPLLCNVFEVLLIAYKRSQDHGLATLSDMSTYE
jgi:hypothetical protein